MTRRCMVGLLAAAALGTVIGVAAGCWATGVRAFVVDSGSMRPVFDPGAIVVDMPVTPRTVYQVGNIVTFHPAPAYTVTHRIAGIGKDGITTKGDANPSADVGTIQPSMIVGRVSFAIPYAGYAVVFFQHPLAVGELLLLLLGLTAVWLLTEEPPASPKKDQGPGAASIDRGMVAVILVSLVTLGAVRAVAIVPGTAAYFTDSHSGSISASIAKPVPPAPVAATVRIEPQTINLKPKGDDPQANGSDAKPKGQITAYIDGLASPHQLSEIDLSSVQLCYQGACIASDGPAKLDGKAHVAATFTRSAVAGLIGGDPGDVVLTVQGSLAGGGTFQGEHTNTVLGGGSGVAGSVPGAAPVAPDPTATPTPAPDLALAPVPTVAAPTQTPDPAVVPAPTPDPAPPASATPPPTPDPAPSASPTPAASPSLPPPQG